MSDLIKAERQIRKTWDYYRRKAENASGNAREYYQGIFEGLDYALYLIKKVKEDD